MRRRPSTVHGWVVLDKPVGMTSTQAVGAVRRLTGASRVGHAGTLDPLASGILPIALGEATKTVPLVQDREKTYRFTVGWGEARDTDDAEGRVIATSTRRPDRSAIEAALGQFIGDIVQVPPRYSAIRIDGERAYDVARAGGSPELQPRTVTVRSLDLVDMPDADHAMLRVVCGKGTYVRAIARDLAISLGTVGYVTALRRLSVGGFTEERAVSLDLRSKEGHTPELTNVVLPIATALDDIPALALTEEEAQRLRHGQTVTLLRRQDRDRLQALGSDGRGALAVQDGRPVALVRVEGADIRPVRVLNL